MLGLRAVWSGSGLSASGSEGGWTTGGAGRGPDGHVGAVARGLNLGVTLEDLGGETLLVERPHILLFLLEGAGELQGH